MFYHTRLLLYIKWRDPGDEAKLHLFGQLKRSLNSDTSRPLTSRSRGASP
ncbi:hypothetical protein METHB2_80063 [Candidatus Methylobacter favarea]|uniref:Uncharacterized protein n=1 Tax=Candidatus Methylobacter favarea TaxID=2707345 RepID=A0A8S0X9W6_9GAMM|nr:hypothetical protein METHB2_80063 [Candidatus Methylobacter favarea]